MTWSLLFSPSAGVHQTQYNFPQLTFWVLRFLFLYNSVNTLECKERPCPHDNIEIILHLYEERFAKADRNQVVLPSRAVCKLP